MENKNNKHDSCRWFITDNNNDNCPSFLTDRNVPIYKKKKNYNRHHNNKTTNQWVRTPMHSGTPTWFSSEGAVELITSTLQ